MVRVEAKLLIVSSMHLFEICSNFYASWKIWAFWSGVKEEGTSIVAVESGVNRVGVPLAMAAGWSENGWGGADWC